jgi:hypothetical protein
MQEFDQQTSPSNQQPPQQQQKQELFEFEALLEIRERDSGNHRSSSHFKNAIVVPGTAMPAATTTSTAATSAAAAAAEDQHGFAVCPLERSCFKVWWRHGNGNMELSGVEWSRLERDVTKLWH